VARTVLDVLQSDGIYTEAACGGAGTCGKCLVSVDGMPCLACQTEFRDGMKIEVRAEERFEVLGAVFDSNSDLPGGGEFGLAVDIGTTTIAFALVNSVSGKIAFSHGVVNSQRALGADVISRIKAADEGKLELLNRFVVEDILGGISYICREGGVAPSAVRSMVIAGNTTMLHILLGLPCTSLGQFPFEPLFIDLQRRDFFGIFRKELLDCEVLLLPGVSAFVGADVCAGVLYGELLEGGVERLLVDLGTNGELARFASGNYMVGTATAAGPAFEAANISCGVGSVAGAVVRARYLAERGVFECETIGGAAAVGLCGSGVLDVAAELVRHGFIDEGGAMDEDFAVAPGIWFTQKDVRELQLAKSAVRAGIEILLLEHELSYDAVDKVYLAGGFGHSLNFESAIALGIFPEEWRGKLESVGNSSLAGCVRVLADPEALGTLLEITGRAREINLSEHPRFNELFMQHIMFEK